MSTQENLQQKEKINLATPKKYKVIVHNDDATPMEFVIELLVNTFQHTRESAEKITLSIHVEGSGIAGVYFYEIAEQKVAEGILASRSLGYPLVLEIEET
jgi:ATP-dependent Clp protease adaptor protein ClpS|tara:strand:- start:386 stop:685 length:300 start_codon:yes stop_codon:yes gene_type:complete